MARGEKHSDQTDCKSLMERLKKGDDVKNAAKWGQVALIGQLLQRNMEVYGRNMSDAAENMTRYKQSECCLLFPSIRVFLVWPLQYSKKKI